MTAPRGKHLQDCVTAGNILRDDFDPFDRYGRLIPLVFIYGAMTVPKNSGTDAQDKKSGGENSQQHTYGGSCDDKSGLDTSFFI